MNPIEIPEPPEPEEVPDLDQLVLNRPLARRTLTIAFTVIGFTLAALTILAVMLFIRVGETAKENHDAIRRLDRLTHPTPKQFEEDLQSGIKRCLRFPDCRRLFPKIKERPARKGTGAPAQRGNSGSTTLARTPGTVAALPESQRGTDAPTGSRPRATTNPPRRRRTPSPGSSPSPPPPSQNPGPTPPSTTIPVPVTLCTDLLRVNCP